MYFQPSVTVLSRSSADYRIAGDRETNARCALQRGDYPR